MLLQSQRAFTNIPSKIWESKTAAELTVITYKGCLWISTKLECKNTAERNCFVLGNVKYASDKLKKKLQHKKNEHSKILNLQNFPFIFHF